MYLLCSLPLAVVRPDPELVQPQLDQLFDTFVASTLCFEALKRVTPSPTMQLPTIERFNKSAKASKTEADTNHVARPCCLVFGFLRFLRVVHFTSVPLEGHSGT